MQYIWYPWLWQAGGDLYSPDLTKVAFNSPEGIEAAKFLYDLKFKDKVIPDITTLIQRLFLLLVIKTAKNNAKMVCKGKGSIYDLSRGYSTQCIRKRIS
ncbi:hypothetical protein ES708_24130 [subsurface metagenome]